MAKGSIRFDDLINVEVAVDPTQGEGAKLLSAVNLVDGQSLGGGGSSDFYLVDISLTGDTDDIVGILYGGLIDYPSESYPFELPSAPFPFADTLPVLTYQGNAILMFNDIFDSGNQSIKSNFTFSTTGDITYDEGDDAFIISGAGTIIFTLK